MLAAIRNRNDSFCGQPNNNVPFRRNCFAKLFHSRYNGHREPQLSSTQRERSFVNHCPHIRRVSGAAILACLLFVFPCQADPPVIPGYDISWFDEFDGNQVDTSLWDVIFSTNPTNNSRHAYLPEQVSVSNGNLVITSENQSFGNLPYRSGQVISKASQQYGRYEVRAKLPTSKGMWPAIWLLPDVDQYPWPSQGEIDIMENRGTQPNLTSSAFHYGTNPPFSHSFVYSEQMSIHGGQLQNYHDSFHTYAVEWSPTELRFFVDGVNHYTVHDADTGGFLSQQMSGMELVINTAVGGTFLEDPDNSTVWPQEFLIDHVYVYERGTPAPLTFSNSGFESNGGTLAEWSTFGNAIPNVQAHQEAVRSGTSSLKLFGQFNGRENYSGVEQGITVAAGEEVRAIARSFIRSADSIAGTNNEVLLNIDYYSQRHGQFGSSNYLSSESLLIANGATANDAWLDHELRSTAPAGAVEARMSLVFRQPSNAAGAVHLDDVLFGRKGDSTLLWDALGDGNWQDQRWTGAALNVPTDFDRAVIRANQVVVTGSQSAFETSVVSGMLNIAGTLTGDVIVDQMGALTASGGPGATIDGALDHRGMHVLVDASSALQVTGTANLDGVELRIDESYQQSRGTLSGPITLINASSLSGTVATPAGGTASHLGDGHFLWTITNNSVSLSIDVYAALPGDANGDGAVDGQDFIIWNDNKFQANTDWLTADFNGDGVTDGQDFVIWNDNKFTGISLVNVPEPSPGFWMSYLPIVIATFAMNRR